MVNIQIYKLNQIIDNIYFLKCENIILYISGISIKFYENIIKNYNENMNKLLEFIQDNKYISKNNFYKENKKYLVININDKINLNDYLLNCIYMYIYYYRSSLIDKFFEIIKRNIIYKKEYNPILNQIIIEEQKKNKLYDKIEILYFNINLFKDLSKIGLNIKIKFNIINILDKIINTLDKIINIYIFSDKYYKIDIFYELNEENFIKNIEKSNIMKRHYNINDKYIIYKNNNKKNKIIYYKKTEKKYNYIFNEYIIINC